MAGAVAWRCAAFGWSQAKIHGLLASRGRLLGRLMLIGGLGERGELWGGWAHIGCEFFQTPLLGQRVGGGDWEWFGLADGLIWESVCAQVAVVVDGSRCGQYPMEGRGVRGEEEAGIMWGVGRKELVRRLEGSGLRVKGVR